MRTILAASSVVFAIVGPVEALAQAANAPDDFSTRMEMRANSAGNSKTVQGLTVPNLNEFSADIPTEQLSELAPNPIAETGSSARSAKDAQIYRAIAPSVVLVVSKEGLGSGSLVSTSGDVITNWHVVKGYSYVALIFKPALEGKEPTRDDTKLGRVVQYDEVADLALVRASDIPAGKNPIRLGDSSEILVGMDVHAIGHPVGETWTYTTGIISQYRPAYEWQAKDDPIKHKADVIQTQTPINPGNSGGPLLSDSGDLVGVNSFIAKGEGLNYAVSVDDVKRFLSRSGNRIAQDRAAPQNDKECTAKELSRFRNKENNASIISFDMFCTGKDSAEYVTPDDKTKSVFLRADRNGDGVVDVVFFDFKRSGKWDLSFWDEKFQGHWTLVGYHDDGTLKPTRFESYAEFQKRVASR